MIRKVGTVRWEEPNRSEESPLHIAARGQRESTITGVAWLDESRFVANHRNGKRVALFDLRAPRNPVAAAELPNLTDNVDVRPLSPGLWEVVTSDCWQGAFTKLLLNDSGEPSFELLETVWKNDRTFCHGTNYGPDGKLWLSLSVGRRPRIELYGERSWELPVPWGARSVCFDPLSAQPYVLANSNNPKKQSYEDVSVSVWTLDSHRDEWVPCAQLQHAHTDFGAIYKGRLWLNDQHGDRVLGLDLSRREKPILLQGEFSFPHGVAISPAGILAVTNYGSSSISFIDLSSVPDLSVAAPA